MDNHYFFLKYITSLLCSATCWSCFVRVCDCVLEYI